MQPAPVKVHALGEPKSLNWLRKRVEKMLPKIDLPDLPDLPVTNGVGSGTSRSGRLCSAAASVRAGGTRWWVSPVPKPRAATSAPTSRRTHRPLLMTDPDGRRPVVSSSSPLLG